MKGSDAIGLGVYIFMNAHVSYIYQLSPAILSCELLFWMMASQLKFLLPFYFYFYALISDYIF
jgi:hypothetical protein